MTNFFKSSQKWKVYEDEEFRLLNRHYPHDHLIDVDVRYRSNNGKVRVEQNLNRSLHNHLSSSTQVQFQIPLNKTDKTIFSSVNSQGKALFSFDNGLIELSKGNSLNLFSSFQTTRGFKEQVYKAGFAVVGQQYNHGLRARYQISGDNKQLLIHGKGSQRGNLDHGRWWLNYFTIYRPVISKLIQNGILFGYTTFGKDVFNFRVESGDRKEDGIEPSDLFKVLKINWRRRLDNTRRIGFETTIDFSNWEHMTSHTYLGGSWRFPDQRTIVKAKISPKLTWAVAVNKQLGSYGHYSLGMEMQQLGKKNTVNFGIKVWLDL